VVDSIFTVDCTSATKTIRAQTDLISKAGTYHMQLKVWYTDFPEITSNKNFSIDIVDVCHLDTLSLDVKAFSLIYNIKDKPKSLSWSDKTVTSNFGLTICGTYEWEIVQTDGATLDPNPIPLDTNIFTLELSIKTINVYTEDFSKAGTYPMQIKVWYTEFPSVFDRLDFKIVL